MCQLEEVLLERCGPDLHRRGRWMPHCAQYCRFCIVRQRGMQKLRFYASTVYLQSFYLEVLPQPISPLGTGMCSKGPRRLLNTTSSRQIFFAVMRDQFFVPYDLINKYRNL